MTKYLVTKDFKEILVSIYDKYNEFLYHSLSKINEDTLVKGNIAQFETLNNIDLLSLNLEMKENPNLILINFVELIDILKEKYDNDNKIK